MSHSVTAVRCGLLYKTGGIDTSHRSSYSILDGPVGVSSSEVFSTMRHIILLRNFYLLAKHVIALGTVMLRCLYVGSFVGGQETSTILLIPQDPDGSVAVRWRVQYRRGNILDMGF